MISAIRQRAVVGEGGKIEIVSSELPAGTVVEVIVLVDTEERDTTSYLLSTEANRRHLREALEDLENPSERIYLDVIDARRAYAAGEYQPTTPDELMDEIL